MHTVGEGIRKGEDLETGPQAVQGPGRHGGAGLNYRIRESRERGVGWREQEAAGS